MENIKVVEEKDNPLFKRREIELEAESHVTPSHSETEKLISEKFSAKAENIKIKKILGSFGSNIFRITANIYQSKEDKERTEKKQKKKKEKK